MTAATKRKLRVFLKYALFALLSLLLQESLLSRLPVAGVTAVLLPVTVACAAMHLGTERGALFGLCAGALWALSGAADGGLLLLGSAVSGALCGWLCDAVFNRRLLTALLLTALSLVLTLLPPLFVRLYLSGGGAAALLLTLRQLALSLLLCLPVYPIGNRLGKAGDGAWTA